MKYYSPAELKTHKEELWSKFKGASKLLELHKKCLSVFEKFLPNKDAKILDCGIGSGRFSKALFEKGYHHISACDIDNYLPRDFIPLNEFKTLDLSFEKLPWPDGFFDAVLGIEFLEHLENPHNAIRQIHRVLKPGGIFIMSVPNILHIVSRLVFLKRGLFPQWNESNNHISVFPRGIFEKTVLKYFELVENGYVGAELNLPILRRLHSLPENEWFGHWVYYILKKK